MTNRIRCATRRLLDGSRVNVTRSRPVGVDGPLVSIDAKFSKKPFNLEQGWVEYNAIKPQMAEVLAAAVRAPSRPSFPAAPAPAGPPLLNALSAFISEKEPLITIEDRRPSCSCSSRTWPAWRRGPAPTLKERARSASASWSRTSLRMRPERIILGECRGEEAFDMLQAMNTGHEGSMATIHANNPREAVSRLEQADRQWPACP